MSSPSEISRNLQVGKIEKLLSESEVQGLELLPQGSNYTFAVELKAADFSFIGIYKPASGERPLWDFPYGTLHKRERCAFLVSQALGWDFVPPTVIRDGPHGEGSMQLYIPPDERSNYFSLREEGRAELVLLAAFDLIVNNTDRKGGHCFKGRDQRIWAIDHGLTFHVDPKLRTVIWDYSGAHVPEEHAADVKRLDGILSDEKSSLKKELDVLLDPEEVAVFHQRVKAFAREPRLPRPEEYRSFPWPPI
ncbi:MAG: SCO1664 family protein [bacterium]|nr:SCO1664 family protein [bacterium]